tara:strand:- start:2827 stop:3711 length:885 start_codon:yes stop_codon:yes gene_type:complete
MEEFVKFNKKQFIADSKALILKHYPGIQFESEKPYKNTITIIPKKDESTRCCPIAMRQHSKNNVYFTINYFSKRVCVKCFNPTCDPPYNLTEESDLRTIVKEAKKRKIMGTLPDVPDQIVEVQVLPLQLSDEDCFDMYTALNFVYVKAKKTDKRPIFSGWTESTLEDNEIFELSKYNIAIATGLKSNIIVVDVDVKDEGVDYFKKLCTANNFNYGNYTLCAQTPSGGLHLYFTYEDIPNSVRLRKRDGTLVGIDIRSTGGCVIAPPSSYEKGSYKFVCVKEPQKCPEFLLSLFT